MDRCENGVNGSAADCDNSFDGTNGEGIYQAYDSNAPGYASPIYDQSGGAFYLEDNTNLTVNGDILFSGSFEGRGAEFTSDRSQFSLNGENNVFTNGSRMFVRTGSHGE